MQPMRSEGGCHGVKGPPFYSCGCKVGVFLFQVVFELWCGEWTVHCSLSTWMVDSWLSIFLGLGGGGVVKAKSSQVFDLFPEKFPIAPYFYPICFGKCCPLFIYIGGSKGKNSIPQNKTFYVG